MCAHPDIHTADGRSIKDNRLHNLLVRPLPRGARLLALFDACEPPGALVVSLAASADDELSFEGALGGLMTGAFVEIMRARRDLTYQDLMVDLRCARLCESVGGES
jgi:hypothetical protein